MTNQLHIDACRAARRGDYSEAIALLNRALSTGACSKAAAYDLMARVHAQQGHMLDAEAYWKQAAAIDGDNPEYPNAIARLRKPGGALSSPVRALLLVMAVGFVFVAQSYFFHSQIEGARTTLSADVADVRGGLTQLNAKTDLLQAHVDDGLARSAREYETLGAGLADNLRQGRERFDELTSAQSTLSQRLADLASEGAARDARAVQSATELRSAVDRLADAQRAARQEAIDLAMAGLTADHFDRRISAMESSLVEIEAHMTTEQDETTVRRRRN